MVIREYSAVYGRELYKLYCSECEAGRVFDVLTQVQSVYLLPTKTPLPFIDFLAKVRVPVRNTYTNVETFQEYQLARTRHENVVLPNGTILLGAYSNYSEEDFKELLQDGFVAIEEKYELVPNTLQDSIFNSQMIENINVSLRDTEIILSGGKAPHVSDEDEALVKNAKQAYEARKDISGFVSNIKDILHLHRILLQNELDKCPGKFRKANVMIRSATHSFPDFSDVERRMQNLCSGMQDSSEQSILNAALHHAEFINIHPFLDGNGRLGRLIVHPFMNVPENRRLEYYTALDAYGSYGSALPIYNLTFRINK